MLYDEIILKVVEGKMVTLIDWTNKQLDNDPEVTARTSREKVNLQKFMLEIREQFRDFLANPDDDNRDCQTDAELFGDNDIAVGPGRTTAVDFMDPPEDADNFDEGFDFPDVDDYGDGDDLDSGDEYDDGFSKD